MFRDDTLETKTLELNSALYDFHYGKLTQAELEKKFIAMFDFFKTYKDYLVLKQPLPNRAFVLLGKTGEKAANLISRNKGLFTRLTAYDVNTPNALTRYFSLIPNIRRMIMEDANGAREIVNYLLTGEQGAFHKLLPKQYFPEFTDILCKNEDELISFVLHVDNKNNKNYFNLRRDEVNPVLFQSIKEKAVADPNIMDVIWENMSDVAHNEVFSAGYYQSMIDIITLHEDKIVRLWRNEFSTVKMDWLSHIIKLLNLAPEKWDDIINQLLVSDFIPRLQRDIDSQEPKAASEDSVKKSFRLIAKHCPIQVEDFNFFHKVQNVFYLNTEIYQLLSLFPNAGIPLTRKNLDRIYTLPITFWGIRPFSAPVFSKFLNQANFDLLIQYRSMLIDDEKIQTPWYQSFWYQLPVDVFNERMFLDMVMICKEANGDVNRAKASLVDYANNFQTKKQPLTPANTNNGQNKKVSFRKHKMFLLPSISEKPEDDASDRNTNKSSPSTPR